MTKLLLLVILIAVIAAIGWAVAHNRPESTARLPGDDRDTDLSAATAHDTALAPPLPDIAATAVEPAPLLPEPEVVDTVQPMEPDPVIEPPPEPDPIVEPEPPVEPDPIVEPGPPVEPVPEPAIEPETEPVGAIDTETHAPAADDVPLAGEDTETPAEHLDAHAGWETEDDTTVHADPESGLFHTPDSPGYKIGANGISFESEDDAQTAGFIRWDQPR